MAFKHLNVMESARVGIMSDFAARTFLIGFLLLYAVILLALIPWQAKSRILAAWARFKSWTRRHESSRLRRLSSPLRFLRRHEKPS